MRILSILTLAGLVALAGCSKPAGSPGASGGKQKLHIYTWADYFKPELLKQFESDNNCEVVIDTFDSNEAMLAKVQAGATGYDLITPTSYTAKAMKREGLLQPLDHAKVPNISHIDPEHLAAALDPKMEISVPYMVGTTVIAYRKDKVNPPPKDWSVMAEATYKGRMTVFDDMREVMGAALKQLGYSLNTRDDAQLEQAKQFVLKWKPNLAKFDSEQYKSGVESGEFLVVMGYSGDILQVMKDSKNVDLVVPPVGVARSCDDFVIPKSAPDAALAHKFINFFCDPKVSAENTEFLGFLSPNKDAYPLLSAEIKSNPAIMPPEEIRKKCEFIDDLGPDIAKYQKIWDEIKGGE